MVGSRGSGDEVLFLVQSLVAQPHPSSAAPVEGKPVVPRIPASLGNELLSAQLES